MRTSVKALEANDSIADCLMSKGEFERGNGVCDEGNVCLSIFFLNRNSAQKKHIHKQGLFLVSVSVSVLFFFFRTPHALSAPASASAPDRTEWNGLRYQKSGDAQYPKALPVACVVMCVFHIKFSMPSNLRLSIKFISVLGVSVSRHALSCVARSCSLSDFRLQTQSRFFCNSIFLTAEEVLGELNAERHLLFSR